MKSFAVKVLKKCRLPPPLFTHSTASQRKRQKCKKKKIYNLSPSTTPLQPSPNSVPFLSLVTSPSHSGHGRHGVDSPVHPGQAFVNLGVKLHVKWA